MLKRIGKIVVVVVGVAGAAGFLSHRPNHQPSEVQWIAPSGAPEPDHPQHGDFTGPPTTSPGAAHLASSSQVNGEFLPVAPGEGAGVLPISVAMAMAFVAMWYAARCVGGPRARRSPGDATARVLAEP